MEPVLSGSPVLSGHPSFSVCDRLIKGSTVLRNLSCALNQHKASSSKNALFVQFLLCFILVYCVAQCLVSQWLFHDKFVM